MTWLYSWVDSHKRYLSNPFQSLLKLTTWGVNAHPWAPGLPGMHEWRAMLELSQRFHKTYEKPAWRENTWEIPTVIEKVWGTPFGNLLHFKTEKGSVLPKLLIAAPLSGHYPTLLRETVREMSKHSDVFITEWINARDVPLSAGEFSLDDYVDFLRQSMRELSELDSRPLSAMSVCQPTVPMLAAAAMMWEDNETAKPSSLVMISGPIDARKSPTATNNFAGQHGIEWFENRLISTVPFPYAGAGRKVYPGFLQHMGFVAMNPSRHAQAHKDYFESLIKGDDASATKHREFYDEYNAVMDLPANYYLQTVKKVFQDFDLPLGQLHLCGRQVRPSFIGAGLLTIEGELDDISGAGQTHSAHDLAPETKKVGHSAAMTVEGVGHYGVFSGSAFRKQIAPKIGEFILNEPIKAARSKRADRL